MAAHAIIKRVTSACPGLFAHSVPCVPEPTALLSGADDVPLLPLLDNLILSYQRASIKHAGAEKTRQDASSCL